MSQAAHDPAATVMTQIFLQPLWLFPVATWLATIGAIAIQLRNSDRRARQTMIAIGAIPLAHSLSLFAFIGHFLGAYALLLAAALIWACAATMQGHEQSN